MSDAELMLMVESRKKSGWIAALLNLVVPGAGYMYCGRWILGIIVFPFVLALIWFNWGIGAVMALVLVIDGFLCAGRYNSKLIERILKERREGEKQAPVNRAEPGSTPGQHAPRVPATNAPDTSLGLRSNASNLKIIGIAVFVGVVVAGAVSFAVLKFSNRSPQDAPAQATTTIQHETVAAVPPVSAIVPFEMVGVATYGHDTSAISDSADHSLGYLTGSQIDAQITKVCGYGNTCTFRGTKSNRGGYEFIETLTSVSGPTVEAATNAPVTAAVSEPSQAQSIGSPTTTPVQVSVATFQPSFDCAKASTGPERLICSSQDLATLDVQLAQTFGRLLNSTSDKESLKREQREWRKNQRDACSTAECMEAAYRTRISELQARTS